MNDFNQFFKDSQTKIIAGASLLSFISVLASKKLWKFSSTIGPSSDPKLDAYLFAGRAFTTASLLTGFGATFIVSSSMAALGANNFTELQTRLQYLSRQYLPKSPVQSKEDQEADWKEWQVAMLDKEDSDPLSSTGHSLIRQTVRDSLGPLAQ